MEEAAVVVLPYREIESSGVLATALGHGRPVVVTDVGSLGETVREFEAGAVVPPEDTAALAAACCGSAPRARAQETAARETVRIAEQRGLLRAQIRKFEDDRARVVRVAPLGACDARVEELLASVVVRQRCERRLLRRVDQRDQIAADLPILRSLLCRRELLFERPASAAASVT